MAYAHRTQNEAPRTICPQCGRFSARATQVIEPSGVWTITALCERNHQWITKWLEGQVV